MIDLIFAYGCAAMFNVEIEGFRKDSSRTYAIVRANNQSSCDIDRIVFECDLMDGDGKFVTTKAGRFRLISPHSYGYDEVPLNTETAKAMECRITTVLDSKG